MHSRAVRPTRSGVTGTSRQAMTRRPSLAAMSSMRVSAARRSSASSGRYAMPTAYAPAGGRSASRTARKKASGTWVRMPAPSPTSGSAPVAPRWSRLRRASRACTTMSWPAVPRIVATMATPQASCSCSRRYRPVSAGWAEKRATVTSHHRPRGRRPLRTGHGKVRRGRLWPRLGRISPDPHVLLSEPRYPTSWDSGSPTGRSSRRARRPVNQKIQTPRRNTTMLVQTLSRWPRMSSASSVRIFSMTIRPTG